MKLSPRDGRKFRMTARVILGTINRGVRQLLG